MSIITYQDIMGVPAPTVLEQLAHLNDTLFGFGETAEILAQFYGAQQTPLTCLAFLEGALVGYKIGYRDAPKTFYSWRGGTHPSARRQGVAETLMARQHAWCRAHGFRVIKTTTNGDNRPMLILNLKSGFEIVGSFVNRGKRLKVLQEKALGDET